MEEVRKKWVAARTDLTRDFRQKHKSAVRRAEKLGLNVLGGKAKKSRRGFPN